MTRKPQLRLSRPEAGKGVLKLDSPEFQAFIEGGRGSLGPAPAVPQTPPVAVPVVEPAAPAALTVAPVPMPIAEPPPAPVAPEEQGSGVEPPAPAALTVAPAPMPIAEPPPAPGVPAGPGPGVAPTAPAALAVVPAPMAIAEPLPGPVAPTAPGPGIAPPAPPDSPPAVDLAPMAVGPSRHPTATEPAPAASPPGPTSALLATRAADPEPPAISVGKPEPRPEPRTAAPAARRGRGGRSASPVGAAPVATRRDDDDLLGDDNLPDDTRAVGLRIPEIVARKLDRIADVWLCHRHQIMLDLLSPRLGELAAAVDRGETPRVSGSGVNRPGRKRAITIRLRDEAAEHLDRIVARHGAIKSLLLMRLLVPAVEQLYDREFGR